MRILITGVAGFLGSHLADALLKQGHNVFGVDNFIGGYKHNIPNGVIFFEGDCDDLDFMKKVLKDIDVVYHCACTAYEGLSVFSPYFITKNTFGITISTLTASIENKVKRFIFCSSMARYGKQDGIFTEDMLPQPQDPYGIAKYASELIIRNLCETHGIEYVIAVPHNIIGSRQKYDDPYRNVVSIFINKMLKGEQPIIYGDGNQVRCFSFIKDVVQPLVLMATEDVVGEIINIGPDEGKVTINHLAIEIAKCLNFDLKPIYVKDRPQEVKIAYCSADKARKLLQYNPQTTLKEGIEDIVSYIKKMGTKNFNYNIDIEINNNNTPITWKQKII